MSKQGNSIDKKRESLSGSYSGVIPNFSDSFEAKTASCLLLLLDFDTIWKIIKTKQNSQEWLVITGPIWHVAVCGFSLHLGSSESHKTLEQKFIFQISTLNSQGIQQVLFIQLIYSCILITIFPPIAYLHFWHINSHTTHNSSNHSDKGLMLET